MPIETQPQPKQTVARRLDRPGTVSPPKSQRIPALDFTKGVLVLIMVLYHWINYFIGLQWKYYPYLRFLTPSFIFITGFMISHVYLSKYSAADPRLWKRLVTRGSKLMAVFLILNLARNLVVPLLGTGSAMQGLPSLASLFAIFVSGNLPVVGTKVFSFSILVPISYLLIITGALMVPFRQYKYVFHVICLVLLVFVAILTVFGSGSYNLEFITIGMIGVLAGFLPVAKVNDVIHHPYWIAFAYLCYTVAIAVWNVPFPLLIIGVVLSLMAIYAVGAGGSEKSVVKGEIILLGKYSLLGYISQVAIIQTLTAGFHHINLGIVTLPVSFVAVLLLTVISVELVDRTRTRFASMDRLYKAVFA